MKKRIAAAEQMVHAELDRHFGAIRATALAALRMRGADAEEIEAEDAGMLEELENAKEQASKEIRRKVREWATR